MRDFTVSVIITTYNSPHYLELTMRSLLRQSVKPLEIIVADDGSAPETARLVEAMAFTANVPVRHVWHEDSGFRRSAILNKAVAAARGDYIIFGDGDIICHRHWVKDHIRMAAPGFVLGGSHAKLSREATDNVFKGAPSLEITCRVKFATKKSLRAPWLMKPASGVYSWFMREHSRRRLITPLGGNMSLWRRDFVAVNGLDENFEGWGYEDADLSFRLRNNGVKIGYIKLGATAYHLCHPLNSTANAEANHRRMMLTYREGLLRCKNGIDKYLLN